MAGKYEIGCLGGGRVTKWGTLVSIEDPLTGDALALLGGRGPLGTGAFVLGDGPTANERRAGTRWLTVLFLPLWPLRGVGSNAPAPGSERGPSAVRSVVMRYVRGFAGALLAIGPLLWALRTVHETGPAQAVVLLFAVGWLLAVLARCDARWSRRRQSGVTQGNHPQVVPRGSQATSGV